MLQHENLCFTVTHFFREQKQKGNPLEKWFFFIEKTNKCEIENPLKKRMQCLFNLKMNKQTNILKRRNNLYNRLEGVSKAYLEHTRYNFFSENGYG